MARTKISEYSTTAGNNTDINSINLAEGCAPSGINDAIRELMRQLKEFQTGGAGDSVNSGGDFSVATNKFTVASASGNTSVAGTLGVTGAATLSSTLAVTGTTTLTGALVANGNATLGDASGDTVTIKGTPTLEVNPTLSGGTANGVLYLNGSKVATSGSALTFDGSKFGIGGTAVQKLSVFGTNSNFHLNPDSSGNVYGYAYNDAGSAYTAFRWDGVYHAFLASGTEAMRLTSTGLGIGTSSPSGKLSVSGSTGTVSVPTNGVQLAFSYGGANYIGTTTAGGSLVFQTGASSTAATIDSSGNLGLGVTPSASAWTSFEVGANGSSITSAGANDIRLFSNARWSGSAYRYLNTAAAGQYVINSGAHYWLTAASGTAGDAITFTQAMTLDASNRLLIGSTVAPASSQMKLLVNSSTANGGIQMNYGAGTGGAALVPNNGAGLIFYNYTGALGSESYTQVMTLDASGNLLVGTTSAQGVGTTIYSPSGVGRIDLNKSASGAATGIGFYYNGTQVGSISYSDTATSFNTSSDYRLKHDIAPMTGALAKVAALKPVTYKWNSDGSDGEGFIAHELAEVCPQAVTGEKDAVDAEGNPQYQGIDTSFLVATLTAAIQELKAEFDAYKASHP